MRPCDEPIIYIFFYILLYSTPSVRRFLRCSYISVHHEAIAACSIAAPEIVAWDEDDDGVAADFWIQQAMAKEFLVEPCSPIVVHPNRSWGSASLLIHPMQYYTYTNTLQYHRSIHVIYHHNESISFSLIFLSSLSFLWPHLVEKKRMFKAAIARLLLLPTRTVPLHSQPVSFVLYMRKEKLCCTISFQL